MMATPCSFSGAIAYRRLARADYRQTGHEECRFETKEAAKDMGSSVAKTTKTTGKKGVHKAASATAAGADKVKEKTQ